VTVGALATPNPEELVRQADIVVAAVGVAELVRGTGSSRGASSSTWGSTLSM